MHDIERSPAFPLLRDSFQRMAADGTRGNIYCYIGEAGDVNSVRRVYQAATGPARVQPELPLTPEQRCALLALIAQAPALGAGTITIPIVDGKPTTAFAYEEYKYVTPVDPVGTRLRRMLLRMAAPTTCGTVRCLVKDGKITAVKAGYTSTDGPCLVWDDQRLSPRQAQVCNALVRTAAEVGAGEIIVQIVGGQPLAVFEYEEHQSQPAKAPKAAPAARIDYRRSAPARAYVRPS